MGANVSIPGDLLLLRFRSFSLTISGVIVTVISCSPLNLYIGAEIWSVFSKEKTLKKYLFRASAFSMGDVAFEPSSKFKVGFFIFVFSLELTYFKNNLGSCLTFLARFSSKDALSDLVSDLNSFLH